MMDPTRIAAKQLFTVATLLMAMGAVSPSQAAAPAEVFTAKHVAKLRLVQRAVISPDGRQIAYVLSVPRDPFKDENGPAWSELHVIREDGSSRPFVTGEVNVSSVAWTPDGKGISFLAKRGKDKQQTLYLIPVDGGEARPILERPDTDIGPYDWRPDGRQVAFVAPEAESKEIEDLKEKGFNQEIFEEDWRPSKVWIATPDETEESKARSLDPAGSAVSVKWSPDGSRLAIAMAPTPLLDDVLMNQRIHIVDAESGAEVRTLDTPGKLGTFEWSPDGKHIALIASADRHDPAPGRLMAAAIEDGELRDLLPEFEGHVTSIAWQDDQTVMFTAAEGVWTTFGEIMIDGTNRKTHVKPGGPVLGEMTLAQNGQSAAFVGESSEHPGEVYAMRHGDQGPRRLTGSNPWLADMRMARQEVIRYQARDGLELEGILVHPLDEAPGRRYPLILTVHGGPEDHVRQEWLTTYGHPGQVAAAKGFVVFYPNYRGSTGRGVAFSKMGQADYAGKEFDDLVDGVDHLVDIGLVDREKVGVTGGSYGGFAAAWGATYYSDRFAAAVMFVGVSDHVSKFGGTNIPQEMYLVHARKYPWDDWQWFMQRSPIHHVRKHRTPLLILHGKDDPRVPPVQSMELYRYLKTLDQAPVRLVWYPGEGHGNRKAAARLDYNLRMVQWMEHYLQGPGGEPPAYQLDYGQPPGEEKENEKTSEEPAQKM